jgi:hypothetical protein
MLNVIKKLSIYMLAISLFILILYISMVNSSKNEVIAKVGEYKITKEEVEEEIKRKYWDVALNDFINEKLIISEANRLGYADPSKKLLEKELDFAKAINNKVDLKDEEGIRFVEYVYFVKLLSKKYTIEDSELRKFLEDENIDKNVYIVKRAMGIEHEVVNKIESELKKGADIEEIESKFNIEFVEEEYENSFANPYNIDFQNMIIGNFVHIHGHSEEHDHEKHDHEEHELLHGIIILSDIKKKTISSLERDREKVLNVYLERNFHKEKLDLINYLRSSYLVETK